MDRAILMMEIKSTTDRIRENTGIEIVLQKVEKNGRIYFDIIALYDGCPVYTERRNIKGTLNFLHFLEFVIDKTIEKGKRI